MTYMKGTGHVEDLGLGKRVILKWNLNKYDVRVWTEFKWLRMGSVVRHCRHDNVHVHYVKGREFMGELDYCHLLKEDSAPWS